MKHRRFLPDLLFLCIVALALVLGLLLFLFSLLREGGRAATTGLGSATMLPSLAALAVIAQHNPLTGSIADAVKIVYQGAMAWLGRQGSLLVMTDPAVTYNNLVVKQLWLVMLTVADSIIGIFIVLAGYQIILAGFSQGYADALEALPKLIFAAVGANASLVFARFWIDLNNLLCAALLAQMGGQALSVFQTSVLVASLVILALPLVALLALLLILLGVQMSVRLGVLIFLTVWLPLLFVLLAHHVTRRYGQAGLTGYAVAALTQALQLSALVLGEKTLLPFLIGSIGPSSALAPVAAILAGIALLWLTLRIPSMLRSWALQPVAESAQVVRSLLFASFVRLLP